MQWLRARHLPIGLGAKGPGKGVPSQLLHVPGVSEAAVHGRGVVCAG